MTYWLVVLLVALGASCDSEAETPVNEVQLLQMARQSSPNLKAIEAPATQSEMEKSLLDSKYETRANLSYDYSRSNEEGMASFMPVFSPTKNFSVGVEKATPYGVKLGVEGFGESINTSDGTINNAARTGARVRLEMDLLKNLFGRMDAAELRSQTLHSERQKVQSVLGKKEFELEVRKLYWALVANQESLELSEELVKSANTQLNDAVKKSRSGAADTGDVARNKALVQSRESSVYLFKYEKERLLSQLKQWIPSLVDKEVTFTDEDLEPTIRGVLGCVESITATSTVDEKESDYFKLIELAEKQYSAEKRKAKTTGDWDLKLTSYYQKSGVGEGFSNAYDRYQDTSQDGYGVGVAVSIPLEGNASKAERKQKAFVDQRFQSDIEITRLKIVETHKEVQKALRLLKDAAKAQQLNVTAMETSLKSMQRKYRQARINLSQLVYEQDTLFSSQLQSIQTKLAVIHALYDYFKIFNHHSCPLNEIERKL